MEAAVYLHGLAADFAVIEHDEHTLLATEVCAYLDQAFRFRPTPGDGHHLAARAARYAGAQNAEIVQSRHRTHEDTR